MAAYPGVPFPGHPSPQPQVAQMPPTYSPSPATAGGSAQITPGTITYTTSAGPDGRVVYHPFRAVPASYQTPSGIVNGIQWIPAEATNVLPAGAQPANSDFAAAWNRNYMNKDEDRHLKDWQYDEDKRRRREEKESAKRVAQWERDRREREKAEERELRKAREKDAQYTRARKKSVSFEPGARPVTPISAYGSSQTSSIYGGGVRSASPIPGYAPPVGGVGSAYGPNMRSPSPLPGYASTTASVYGGTEKRSASPIPGYAPPTTGSAYGGTYAPTGGFERERRLSSSIPPDLDRRFEGMGINNSGYERTRKVSGSYPPVGGSTYMPGYPVSSGVPGGYPETGSPYGSSAYPTPLSQHSQPYGPGVAANAYPPSPGRPEAIAPRAPSSAYDSQAYSIANTRPVATGGTYYPPSPRPADAYGRPSRPPSPYVPGGARPGVYPPGHVLEGQPMRSRAPSPAPPGMAGYPLPVASPNLRGGALAGVAFPGEPPVNQGPPEGFARPPNLAQPYTPFDRMKVFELDELEVLAPPRMPVVLGPHDVYPEDWNRMMQDLALAWTRKLPVPEVARTGRVPKRSSVAAGLIEEWNFAFFYPRGVELIMYKGRERRTGRDAGIIDDLPEFDIDEEDISSDSDISEDTDSSLEDRYQYGEYGGVYGRQMDPNIAALREQRRRRKEKKAEKKRREKEKKVRRKMKEREKKYSLYITSVEPQRTVAPGGYTGSVGSGTEW
ncbi:hypothetical protein NEOLEDRAFT_1177189 [Neolentinus lepideus HHB14362 ss-1]|uniref:Uncharacterized protein n=1 Tax=Neolentinus lepideus HHB14362 ss-1 TaxID=1314782 RepID=A0A165TQC4_9AGAM|nr:hypothetical protein NEOLEDRAFT_1177189 [Neolentinus lepideus HHB14362 ss-1]